MDEERLRAVLESLLFAAGEPVSLARLAAVLDPVPKEAIREALAELKAGFYREGRGVMLDEVAGGFQLRTSKEHALYVRKLLAARPPAPVASDDGDAGDYRLSPADHPARN